MYKELSTEMFNLYLIVLTNSKEEDVLFEDFKNISNTVLIIEKRVNVFNLKVQKTGILAICILGEFNPGKCILCLHEVMEKALELKPEKIDISFVTEVFPDGFYEDKEAFERIDKLTQQTLEKRKKEHIQKELQAV